MKKPPVWFPARGVELYLDGHIVCINSKLKDQHEMKLSARPKLAATVTGIDKRVVNSTVQIDTGGDATVTGPTSGRLTLA